MKRLASLFLLALFILTPGSAFASNICEGSRCTIDEVGPFMQGITKACGNFGTCSLNDIMRVFENVGEFVLGIIGSLVLLMYVIGGLMFITSGGDEGRVTKGKQMIKVATIGLLIVFVSYTAVTGLNNALRNQGRSVDAIGATSCSATGIDEGRSCGPNMVCTDDGRCVSACEAKYGSEIVPLFPDDPSQSDKTEQWMCTNNEGAYLRSDQRIISCESSLCPGSASTEAGANFQCCHVRSGFEY